MATDSRYANGKVYKLVNDVDEEIYVGSTCLPLRKRMYFHKNDAKKKTDRRVCQHLDKVGFENVHIILIENFACNSKEELLARERHWIETLKPSLNKVVPLRTDAEYREAHKDKIHKQQREYHEANKDAINARRREYHREYREANRDVINARKRELYARKKAEREAQAS